MKLTQKRLNEIIMSHGKWLKDEKDGKRADLSDADLRNANLRYANLSRANLDCADLRSADLSGANLSGANLSDTDLCDTNLSGANLYGANLNYTNLNKTYYQIVRIGNRNATTTYCVEDDNIICGCWNNYKGGTLAEFKERVESMYGEYGEMPNKKYYTQYIAAIEFFKKMTALAKEEQ